MKQLRLLWLFLAACGLVLAGWQSVPPVVIMPGSTGYELSSGYAEWEREQACASIIPFDGEAAYQRHPSDEKILWTFVVNFDLLSPTGNPVGCLRLYHKVEPPTRKYLGTFEAIDDGGILVDTCTPEASGFVALDEGVATFNGGGYVKCAMDIQQWVSLITTKKLLSATYQDLLEDFSSRSIHSYQSFTMVASLSAAQSTGTRDLPIMYYDTPMNGFFWTLDQTMLIRVEQGNGINFPRGACTSATVFPSSAKPIIWWFDFEQRSVPIRKYVYQIEPSVYPCPAPTPALSPPLFWIGAATLYIGNTPTSRSFQGSLDGVLVDPTDSRPPKLRGSTE